MIQSKHSPRITFFFIKCASCNWFQPGIAALMNPIQAGNQECFSLTWFSQHSKVISASPGGTRTSTNNVLETPERQTKGVPCHYWGSNFFIKNELSLTPFTYFRQYTISWWITTKRYRKSLTMGNTTTYSSSSSSCMRRSTSCIPADASTSQSSFLKPKIIIPETFGCYRDSL